MSLGLVLTQYITKILRMTYSGINRHNRLSEKRKKNFVIAKWHIGRL